MTWLLVLLLFGEPFNQKSFTTLKDCQAAGDMVRDFVLATYKDLPADDVDFTCKQSRRT